MDTKKVGIATRAVAKAEKKLVKVTSSKDAVIAKSVDKAEKRFAGRLTAAQAAVVGAKEALVTLVNGTEVE